MNGSRQGYRDFVCEECRTGWRVATRDCFSPSVDTCPGCSDDVAPIGGERHDVGVDKYGNLLTAPRPIWVESC